MKIIFEFAGGSRDEQTSIGDTKFQHHPDHSEALGYYWVSHEGRIGDRFCTPTPLAKAALISGQADELRRDNTRNANTSGNSS